MNRYTLCPCDSKKFYAKCCQPFHDGALPGAADLLMRSRYAAYALGLSDYIISTTHTQNPSYSADHAKWAAELQQFSQATSFIGLRINDSGEDGDTAFVSFTAYLQQGGEDASFTERSTFVKQNGQWLYRDGEMS